MKWTPERIKALRKAFGDSQEEFARRCRASLPTIQHWEQGKGEPLGTATLGLDYLEKQAIQAGLIAPTDQQPKKKGILKELFTASLKGKRVLGDGVRADGVRGKKQLA